MIYKEAVGRAPKLCGAREEALFRQTCHTNLPTGNQQSHELEDLYVQYLRRFFASRSCSGVLSVGIYKLGYHGYKKGGQWAEYYDPAEAKSLAAVHYPELFSPGAERFLKLHCYYCGATALCSSWR